MRPRLELLTLGPHHRACCAAVDAPPVGLRLGINACLAALALALATNVAWGMVATQGAGMVASRGAAGIASGGLLVWIAVSLIITCGARPDRAFGHLPHRRRRSRKAIAGRLCCRLR